MSIYHRVGQVLKPYNDHLGYSIIVEKGDVNSKVLTDFGNIIEITNNELHRIQVLGVFEWDGSSYCNPPENPLERLRRQMEKLKEAEVVLVGMGFDNWEVECE